MSRACKEVGSPTTLAELGITTDEQIRQIAKSACVPGESIHNMVADVTEDQLGSKGHHPGGMSWGNKSRDFTTGGVNFHTPLWYNKKYSVRCRTEVKRSFYD